MNMHYHLEIIMPPTDNLEGCISQILHPFNENCSEDDENALLKHSFWDWWKIGGRWGGEKIMAILGQDRIDAFQTELVNRNITVSGLQWGKQTLSPASQATLVDAIWNDFFPDSPIKECPIFDNYEGDAGDAMKLANVPRSLKCARAIIAGPDYEGKGMMAHFMVSDTVWNGVNHQKTDWDGTIGDAISRHIENIKIYKDEYAAKRTPTDEWIVVTVDYHC